MRRLESRKSLSSWWDSHISPKNSKWFSENLEEMEQNVKRMLKLIEQDADSFAKKAEMYYQKRPELAALVGEFHRGYRALAERYDQVTIDLRNHIPSGLQSQGSGISDVGSETFSIKAGHHKSGNRAAGFDFFLGSGGNGSDVYQNDGDESYTLTDFDDESDDSLVNNYLGLLGNDSDPRKARRMVELENEPDEVKERPLVQEEGRVECSFKGPRIEDTEELYVKINAYELELMISKEKLRLQDEEITKLKSWLLNYTPSDSENLEVGVELSSTEGYINIGEIQGIDNLVDKEMLEPNVEIDSLGEELRITKEKLKASGKQIALLKFEANESAERIQQLQDQLDMAQKDTTAWKTKLNSEKRIKSKLHERLAKLKSSLLDRDHELRDLRIATADAERKMFNDTAQLKFEMSKLLEEQSHLKELIEELECRDLSLEDEIRKILSEKIEMEDALKGEIELLKIDIETRDSSIKDFNVRLDDLKLERDNLKIEVGSLKEEVNSRDCRIEQLDNDLNQLQMEHVQVNAGMEEAQRQVEELESKAKQLEEEVETQNAEIIERSEEKREAIRQLCFSVEHYRNNYNILLQHFKGHKWL
ncbi:putative protein Networked (NET), actin-binding (NAB) [Lupinus albus]|uniref:NAB domain-containing protein n=1 Tax=Lupinus albus TaxID=3870 RepID=A0A6A4QMD0_LUPAL|nr:putative protein Networked (NET), actin-binding (NAB) [Lupinus albus]